MLSFSVNNVCSQFVKTECALRTKIPAAGFKRVEPVYHDLRCRGAFNDTDHTEMDSGMEIRAIHFLLLSFDSLPLFFSTEV